MDQATSKVIDPNALADWRRRVSEMYAGIRSVPNHAVQAWQGWRNVRDDLMKTHTMSPLSVNERATFKELEYFDYDTDYRFLVDTKTPEDRTPETIELMDDGGLVIEPVLETIGLTDKLGSELTIYWINGYGGGLFLPFADATNRQTTYGGGRYLLDSIKGADLGSIEDGRMILDFNFAYNPSCAYSPRWSCPLTPARNNLPGAVIAGEKHQSAND